MTYDCEQLTLGASLRGLRAALEQPHIGNLVVEAAPQPGGSTRTRRSNGFGCELGRFAFTVDEVRPLLERLERPLRTLEAQTATGLVFDGNASTEVEVDPVPISFRSGCEELFQACRRHLGATLRLGRAASALEPIEAGWEITLAGEVPARIRARKLSVCLPPGQCATLLRELDPALAEVAATLVAEPRAFVFLGGLASSCADLRGYGIVPATDVQTPVAETIFCTNAFPGLGLGDRFLLRSEVTGAAARGTDAEITAVARSELHRWTGNTARFDFTLVHRFETTARDAAWAECRARLQGLATRCTNLRFL